MRYIAGLLYENGEPSLVRLISTLNWFVFIWVLWYVCHNGRAFAPEEWYFWGSVAGGTGGFGGVLPMANKYYNSRYNTPEGGYMSKYNGGGASALRGTQLKV